MVALKKSKMESKKGQITLFVILALAILVVLFLLFSGGDVKKVFVGKSPVTQIQDCVSENVKAAIDILDEQGGSINPKFYYEYDDKKLEYLCYTDEFYQPCIVQNPLLRKHVEDEISSYINPLVRECVNAVKSDLEKDGYAVRTGEIDTKVDIVPGNILVDLRSDLTITKDESESYKSIKTDVNSNLYELIMIATSITNLEASYGDSNVNTYTVQFPFTRVDKIKRGDGTKVYILTDLKLLDKFAFASRGLVYPVGLTNV